MQSAHHHSRAPHSTRRSSRPSLLTLISLLYLGAMAAVWLMLLKADAWRPATIVMFSPRWMVALPLLILLPLAVYRRGRWSIIILLAAGLIAAGPVTSFNVPWQRIAGSAPEGKPFKVMTLNMHYLQVDTAVLDELIEDELPDVICIQEWPGWEHTNLKTKPEWHIHGTPRLFVASRLPIVKVVDLGSNSMGEHASAACYDIETNFGLVHVFSLHAATDRQGIQDTIDRNRQGSDEVRANSLRRREQFEYVAAKTSEVQGPILIVGDFNTPPESVLFEQVWRGYTDAFNAAGWGWGYTFHGSATWVRIDHVLFGAGWQAERCRVGPYVSSPHRPVIAELIWTAP